MKITEFTPGDLITRTEPYKRIEYNSNLGIEVEIPNPDLSFVGDPFIFVGIENNCVYLRFVGSFFDGKIRKEPLQRIDDDNWEYFSLPKGVTIDEIKEMI